MDDASFFSIRPVSPDKKSMGRQPKNDDGPSRTTSCIEMLTKYFLGSCFVCCSVPLIACSSPRRNASLFPPLFTSLCRAHIRPMQRGPDDDFEYPIDWRRSPVTVGDAREATLVAVRCNVSSKMAGNIEVIAQSGLKAVEQELAFHGVHSMTGTAGASSPVTRKQCRDQLRSHVRYTVALDFLAPRSLIFTGDIHEAAELVYAGVAARFPLAVAVTVIGITDDTRTFRAAEALAAGRGGPFVDNEHAFVVGPNGRAEAAQLRQRIAAAARDKTAFSGVRLRRQDATRSKFVPPPPPDWLVQVEERRRRACSPQFGAAFSPPRSSVSLPRCDRCARFERGGNDAAAAAAAAAAATALLQRRSSSGQALAPSVTRCASSAFASSDDAAARTTRRRSSECDFVATGASPSTKHQIDAALASRPHHHVIEVDGRADPVLSALRSVLDRITERQQLRPSSVLVQRFSGAAATQPAAASQPEE